MSEGVKQPDLRDVFDPGRERSARLARRFYKQVSVAEAEGGHAVFLDARELKSPGRRKLRLPSEGLASAVAREWDAQQERIDPAAMPVTRIVATATDRVAPDPGPARAEIMGFAGSDLVCYRAEEPDDLVIRQAKTWDPLLAWFEDETAARLTMTSGIMHVAQDAVALQRVSETLAALDAIRLTALHTAVTLTGSVVIGYALLRDRLTAGEAWAASRIDEDFQQEQWGEDAEAAARAKAKAEELEATARVMRLLD